MKMRNYTFIVEGKIKAKDYNDAVTIIIDGLTHKKIATEKLIQCEEHEKL